MEKIAFLFPGQGSQYVGMGKDLYETFKVARKIYDQAQDILGFPLKRICFEGPEEDLKQTRFTQPAIFVHSMVVDTLLKQSGIQPLATAGHSLGEYSALVSAGALSLEDGLRLVKIRGELMQISGEKNPGTMAAIMGVSSEGIREICEKASPAGIVQPANFNCPGQVVISGSISAVHRAMEIAREAGVRLVKELVVSGAFHSPLMEDALDGLIQALKEVKLTPIDIPIYNNVEALPVRNPEDIRESLRKQLLSPVLWEKIVQNMITDGFSRFYEVGPGRVLQGLARRIDRRMPCLSIGTVEALRQLEN